MGLRTKLCATVFCLSGTPFALSQIHYSLTPDLTKSRVKVVIEFTATQADTTIELPAWAPGSYRLNAIAEQVQNTEATVNGQAVNPGLISRGKWRFPTSLGSQVEFTYTVPIAVTAGAAHMAGPSTYMYLVGRKREECDLKVAVPSGGRIVTGLDPKGDGFVAPTYDVLADNPITVGDCVLDTYRVAGKTHYICLYGPAKAAVDRGFLTKICSFVSRSECDLFGGAPYNRYVWHFRVNEGLDGGGGLEHLSSTEISMASGMGPGVVGVYAHEFFHLWNVKRIRSKALGPFDYTQLPQTGALWWLEGVTDYYAYAILRRYGWLDDKQYMAEIAQNMRNLRGNRARFVNSPYDASYRVRDAANGRGNSNGLGISYYEAGHQLGLIFDIELLARTNGKFSLDDVEKALWNMCRDDQPGFEEGEIRRQLVRFGGDELGELYDRIVMAPGELPMEQELAKIGFAASEKEVVTPRVPVVATPRGAKIGMLVSLTGDAFKEGDVIVSINGVSLTYPTTHQIMVAWNQAVEKLKEGDSVALVAMRDKAEVHATVKATKRCARTLVIESVPTPSKDQLALRRLLFAAHRR